MHGADCYESVASLSKRGESGYGQTGTERSTEVVRAVDGCTDTFAEQRYRENEVFEISAFGSMVGLKT